MARQTEITNKRKIIDGLTTLAEQTLDGLEEVSKTADMSTASYDIKKEAYWICLYNKVRAVIDDLPYFPNATIQKLDGRFKSMVGEEIFILEELNRRINYR